jgi:hypothetical protein
VRGRKLSVAGRKEYVLEMVIPSNMLASGEYDFVSDNV